MKLCENEQKAGKQWFLVVGTLAVIVGITLYSLDNFLADPSRRNAEDDTLKTLRQAQYAQVWDKNDLRIDNNQPNK